MPAWLPACLVLLESPAPWHVCPPSALRLLVAPPAACLDAPGIAPAEDELPTEDEDDAMAGIAD